MNFLSWLLSIILAFTLGVQSGSQTTETDDELRSRVQEHLDVIVDEGAAIVDEVTESLRKDEKTEEPAGETAEAEATEAEPGTEPADGAEPEAEPGTEPADAPMAGEPING